MSLGAELMQTVCYTDKALCWDFQLLGRYIYHRLIGLRDAAVLITWPTFYLLKLRITQSFSGGHMHGLWAGKTLTASVRRKQPDQSVFGGFQIVLRKNKDFNDIWAQSGLAWALMTWPKGHESNVARDSLTYIDILCIQWVSLSSSRQTREHLKKVL